VLFVAISAECTSYSLWLQQTYSTIGTGSALSFRSFASSADRKTTQLKKMIQGKDMAYIMEAHSGLSAKIVEETGFKVLN